MAVTRRQSILDAALDSFDATGGTAIDEVKARSGASVGSIYHHFGGKDGIAAALYVEILRGYQQGFVLALRSAAGAEAGIKALVRHHLRWVERHPAEARFLLESGAGAAAGDELRALNRELFTHVEAWLARQEAIRPVGRDVFYAVVIGPAQEASRHWLAGRMKSLRRLEPDLTEAAWRAIKA
jgi:AcrR family transcriptional regulator